MPLYLTFTKDKHDAIISIGDDTVMSLYKLSAIDYKGSKNPRGNSK